MSEIYIVSLAPVAPVFEFYLAFAGLFVANAFAMFSIGFSVWAIFEFKKRGFGNV